MIAVLFASLLLFIAMGVPVAFALGLGGLLALVVDGQVPLEVVPQRAFAALDSWALMAVPLFILAGELMNSGGLSRRAVEFADGFIGRVKGRLSIVTVSASMLFAGVSGSSSADTAAVGSVMIPAMQRRGYDPAFATALQAAAGAIGPIIPPSIIMIVMGFVTETSIAALFVGGLIPGLLIGTALMVTGWLHASNRGVDQAVISEAPRRHELAAGLAGIGMPIVVLGGILSGAFTATEAAAIAVAYALAVGLWVFRELRWSDLPQVLLDSALRSCVVMFVATSAFLFAWLVAVGRVPEQLSAVLEQAALNRTMFLLACNVILLCVGLFMESISAIIVIMPILFPLAMALGIDPVHFGVLASVNLCIGMVTPPYGATLFVACTIANRSVAEVAPWTLWPVVAMIIVQLLITLLPATVLGLPGVFGLL